MIKVLVVDDEPLARKRVTSLVSREQDLQLIGESGDGLDALAKIRELGPDLLFLDIKMPGLSGLELSRSLRAEKPPYIIFTTAYGQYAVDAFAVDAIDYLVKPFDRERFRHAID
ncbi:MAG: LytR/AlgR family response regulator transcription factor, partial [Gammaproteobacteria bacterium]